MSKARMTARADNAIHNFVRPFCRICGIACGSGVIVPNGIRSDDDSACEWFKKQVLRCAQDDKTAISFGVSHPSDKDKGVARVGHPVFTGYCANPKGSGGSSA